MAGDSSESSPNEVRLADLSRCVFEDKKAVRGGALVIDESGKPLEFRCTSPIRPNAVQKMLYGRSLQPYILVELIGRPLLKGLREQFDFIVVNSPFFLNLREHFDRPCLFVRRQGEEMTAGSDGEDRSPSELVDSPKYDPVVMQGFEEYPEDTKKAYPIFQALSKRMNILEPFERIARALERVHEERKLDQQ